MSKPPAIHYAGRLQFTNRKGMTTYISAGYAACCSGPRSLKIAELGQHSYKAGEVTCKACLTAIAKARFGPSATRHPSTFKHYFRCECGAVEIGSSAPIPDSMQQCLECNVKEKATLQ